MSGYPGSTDSYNKNKDLIERYLKAQFPRHVDYDFAVEVRLKKFIEYLCIAKCTKYISDKYTFQTPLEMTTVITRPAMYPIDLDKQQFWNYDLEEYGRQLRARSPLLFCNKDESRVRIIASAGAAQVEHELRTNDELRDRLTKLKLENNPRVEHFFIRARSAVDSLYLDKIMFETLFMHYKVMPTFLDFLFTFGEQVSKKNFQFSGFRSKDLWMESNFDASILPPSCRFQLCYNLRGVDPTKNPPEWPWSIRQTAIFHSYECDSGNAAWINVKSSTDISPCITRLSLPSAPADPASMTTTKATFGASLATHLAYCEWSGKNWAAYISFFEDQLQEKTGQAILAKGPVPHQPQPSTKKAPRTESMPVPVKRAYTFVQAKEALAHAKNAIRSYARTLTTSAETAVPASEDLELGLRLAAVTTKQPAPQEFTYDDLRKLQDIEEKANVALFVIKANISIMGELRDYYTLLDRCKAFQHAMGQEHSPSVARFSSQISALINDSKLQQSRIEAMLRLLADRKSLLLQLFAHRNMSTNRELADKSQASSDKMEALTEQMKLIALKTESETIFMRIITIVTLFFLPGTFVATLMSTDILRFQDDGKLFRRFSGEALGAYLGITIPIMVVTFWAAFHFWHRAASRPEETRN